MVNSVKHNSGWLLLAAGLLTLSACATTPVLESSTVQPPSQWSAVAQPGPVEAGWLVTFNDAQLLRLVDEAIARNHDLRSVAARLDEAQAAARKAAAPLVPTLGANVGGQRAGDFESGTQSDSGVSLAIAWELDVWGRIRSAATAASSTAEAASGDYAYARLSLAAQTAKAWLQAIETQRQQTLAQTSLDNLQEMLRIVSVRQREGLASGFDTHLIQTDLGVAESSMQETANAHLDALRSLELLLGRYPAAELAVRESLPALPPPAPASLPAELLERRPDLRAAEAEVAAAFAVSKQARAARLPRLSLTGAAGSASSALQSLILPLDSFWYIGLNLFQPLIDGGRLQADVEISDARQRAAIERYAGKVLNAFNEVERSLSAETSLRLRSQSLGNAAQQATRAHRLAKLRYQEGESDLLDVLQLHQRLLEIQQSLYRVELLQLTERVNLHLALGGDFQARQ